MNIFHVLILLASKEFKEKQKKMSLQSLYNDFKENCKIKKKIIKWKKDENKFSIVIYCLEENINVNKEMELLNKLCKKYGLW